MQIYIVLGIVLITSLVTLLKHFADAKRDSDPNVIATNAEKEARMQSLVKPGETLKHCCRTHQKAWCGVTENALIMADKAELRRIAFADMKSVKLTKMDGSKTKNIDSVSQIVIQTNTNDTYKLFKYSEEFLKIAEVLMQAKG